MSRGTVLWESKHLLWDCSSAFDFLRDHRILVIKIPKDLGIHFSDLLPFANMIEFLEARSWLRRAWWNPPPALGPPLPIPLPYASEPRFASALWAWKDLVTFLY